MTDNPAAIEFRHVTISFDDKLALDDLSFRLAPGQMICITGVSGSGKSVLLRVAAGLSTPDAGEVLVEGRPITALDEFDMLALRSCIAISRAEGQCDEDQEDHRIANLEPANPSEVYVPDRFRQMPKRANEYWRERYNRRQVQVAGARQQHQPNEQD